MLLLEEDIFPSHSFIASLERQNAPGKESSRLGDADERAAARQPQQPTAISALDSLCGVLIPLRR